METLENKINRKLNEFINKIVFLGKKNTFKFRHITLYPSEIHLILVMSEAPTNATQMAQALKVSKGAVSQTISRLEKKGILKKTKDPYLKNELTLSFTPLGNDAFKEYKQMSRLMGARLHNKISVFSPRELETINRFLDQVMDLPDRIQKGPA